MPKMYFDNPMEKDFASSVIGPLLKYHRHLNMLTLMDAVEFIGISHSSIQSIEKQKYENVQYQTVQSICNAFNIAVSDVKKFDPRQEIHLVPKYISQFVRENRERLCLNKRALAQRADFDESTVRYLENRLVKKPSKKVIGALCKVFDCDPSDIALYSTVKFQETQKTLRNSVRQIS